MTAVPRPTECSAHPGTLFVAFDLGNRRWKVASTARVGGPVRQTDIAAGDRDALAEELRRAKARFHVAPDARVVSCYEAGRDGFGPHRLLGTLGVENLVVDPTSLDVSRRARRAKTDRIDAAKLLVHLLRYVGGESCRWRVVRVPSVEVEDRRQLHRELATTKADRVRLRNRITSLVAAQGGRVKVDDRFAERVPEVCLPDGRRLPVELQGRLQREWRMLDVVEQRIAGLEGERHSRGVDAAVGDREIARVKQLMRLRAIGEASAWQLVFEYFWRRFDNRRQVAAGAGLTPTPFNSGASAREQGISKAGNGRVRALVIELAWGWLRWQRESELTRWFRARFDVTKRTRRIGIVALARRLLIALWRFLETGELPAGAVLKPVKAAR
jgi:transposase